MKNNHSSSKSSNISMVMNGTEEESAGNVLVLAYDLSYAKDSIESTLQTKYISEADLKKKNTDGLDTLQKAAKNNHDHRILDLIGLKGNFSADEIAEAKTKSKGVPEVKTADSSKKYDEAIEAIAEYLVSKIKGNTDNAKDLGIPTTVADLNALSKEDKSDYIRNINLEIAATSNATFKNKDDLNKAKNFRDNLQLLNKVMQTNSMQEFKLDPLYNTIDSHEMEIKNFIPAVNIHPGYIKIRNKTPLTLEETSHLDRINAKNSDHRKEALASARANPPKISNNPLTEVHYISDDKVHYPETRRKYPTIKSPETFTSTSPNTNVKKSTIAIVQDALRTESRFIMGNNKPVPISTEDGKTKITTKAATTPQISPKKPSPIPALDNSGISSPEQEREKKKLQIEEELALKRKKLIGQEEIRNILEHITSPSPKREPGSALPNVTPSSFSSKIDEHADKLSQALAQAEKHTNPAVYEGLGITGDFEAGKGFKINKIVDQSTASDMKLKPDQIITHLNGKDIRDTKPEDLLKLLNEFRNAGNNNGKFKMNIAGNTEAIEGIRNINTIICGDKAYDSSKVKNHINSPSQQNIPSPPRGIVISSSHGR